MTVVVSVEMGGTSASSSSAALTALGAASTTVVGALPKVTSVIYPGDDTAANNIGGQTLYINGSGFLSNSNVYINGNAVPSKSFISASNLQFTTSNLTNGIYPIYVVNYDGSTALLVPGLVVSSEPSWNTAAGSLSSSQDASSAWSYSLSANGDAPITYALAAGSSLPTGISLAANGLISGTITSPPSVETTYTFSVVATDAQNQDATRQFSVTATVGDAYFPYTTLLLHGDGTNNKNNHTFIDSSNNNFTITRNGNATQGTFTPFGNTWSGLFSANTTYLSLADTANIRLGSGDFTVECFIQTSQTGNAYTSGIAAQYPDAAGAGCYIFGLRNNVIYIWDNATSYVGTANVATSAWTHVAWVRSGSGSNNNKVYVNGVLDFQFTNTTNFTGGTAPFRIGAWGSTSTGYGFTSNTYISNFRIIKDATTYTGAFTPPTSPLTAVSNTAILACQSNRFIDNSTNAFTLTVNGTSIIQRSSPFNPSAAYSAANTGGSAYMDGSTDYLLTAASSNLEFGSGDFTIDFWWYPQSTSRQGIYHGSFGTDWSVGIDYGAASGKMGIWASSSGSGWNLITADTSQGQGTTTIIQNAWNHVVYQRSGTTWNLYVNGNRDLNLTVSGTIVDRSASQKAIGSWWSTGSMAQLTGYLSNFRIVKGTALYSGATIAVPSAPTTNVANTQLLMNFTNAGIIDNAMTTVLETIGDAKVSTAQYKYGTASIAFDGTGDRLYSDVRNNKQYNFGVGGTKFTFECWVYFNSVASGVIAGKGGGFAGWNSTNGHQMNLGSIASGNFYLQWWNGSTVISNSITTPFSTGQWYHYAVSYDGSTIKAYKDGTAIITVSSPTFALPSAAYYFTIGDLPSADGPLNGYIDDLRITNGYARYTSNFTPPTSAFKDR